MKIGLDYWNCCSHHPGYFRSLATLALTAGHEVHVVSAVGRRHAGSVAPAIAELGIPVTGVHEVLFKRPVESPALKVAKCLELGFGGQDAFYDDRDDVCRAMTAAGILAMRVTRADGRGDVEAELQEPKRPLRMVGRRLVDADGRPVEGWKETWA